VQDGIDNGVQYTQSKTLEIHGGKNSWEGNVCFNDNHIQFERTFYPQGMACVPGGLTPPAGDTSCGTGTAAAGVGLENIFKEDDAVNRTDAFMCIVSQVQASGSGSNVTTTHTINWD
jgi:hypothetical protein